jgi:hypothetical protein
MDRKRMSAGFSGELPPERLNLARYCIATSARHTPDKIALTIANGSGFQQLTFAEIEDAVLRLSSAFGCWGCGPASGCSSGWATVSTMQRCFLLPMRLALSRSRRLPCCRQRSRFMIQDSGASAIVHDGTLELPPLDEAVKVDRPG